MADFGSSDRSNVPPIHQRRLAMGQISLVEQAAARERLPAECKRLLCAVDAMDTATLMTLAQGIIAELRERLQKSRGHDEAFQLADADGNPYVDVVPFEDHRAELAAIDAMFKRAKETPPPSDQDQD
jgi:hypothetical protein